MKTCEKCGREHEGEGPICDACLSAASDAAPVVVTPATRDLSAPATVALVVINAVVFVFMVLKRTPVFKPTAEQIIHFGGNSGLLSLGTSQWWRMLTAIFVHIGLWHLLINEWCLWDLGFMAEHLYGPRTFLAVYILSGLTGSFVSIAYNPSVVSAGASGAIFGIAGALINTLHFGHIPAPPKALRASLVSLLVFAGFNLIYGLLKVGIDNGAHVGGFVAGLILGAILSRDFGTAPDQHRHVHRWAIPLIAVILVVAFVALRHYKGPAAHLGLAQETLARGDTKGSIRQASEIIHSRPNYAAAWLFLGEAYLRTGQLHDAENALKKAATLDAKSERPLAELAILYLSTNRLEEAAIVMARMTEINPKDYDAFANRGVALNRLNRQTEAVECFKRAVALNPKQAIAWYNLGLTYMSLKQYDNAVNAFQEVTKLLPDDPDAWVWLSNAYQQKGMGKEADAAYVKAVSLRSKRMQQMQRQQQPRR